MSTAVDPKPLATLRARAALVGMTCSNTDAGNVVLARCDAAWVFGTVEKVNAWLDRLDQRSTEVPA